MISERSEKISDIEKYGVMFFMVKYSILNNDEAIIRLK